MRRRADRSRPAARRGARRAPRPPCDLRHTGDRLELQALSGERPLGATAWCERLSAQGDSRARADPDASRTCAGRGAAGARSRGCRDQRRPRERGSRGGVDPHRSRARGSGSRGRWSTEQAGGGSPRDLGVHGEAPCPEHPAEACSPVASRGRCVLPLGLPGRRQLGRAPFHKPQRNAILVRGSRRAQCDQRDGIVNTTERSALVQGALFYDQVASAMDDRTLEILERRRATSTVRRRGWLVRRMLLAADLLGLSVAFIAAQLFLGLDPNAPNPVDATMEWLLFFGTLPAWIVVAKLYGLYERDEERTDHSTVDDMLDVFHMVTVGAWVLVVAAWLTGLARPDIIKLALFWAFAIALVTLGRVVARTFCRSRVTYLQNAVIVGAGEVGQLIGRKLLQHPEYGINLVGFVDAEPKERRADLEHLTLLGPPERLATIIRLFDVERVLIAFSNESHDATLQLIRSLKDLDVQIDIVPRLFDIVGTEIGIHTVEGLPLLGLRPLRLSSSSQLLKRSMDVLLAGIGLLLLAPLFAAVAV